RGPGGGRGGRVPAGVPPPCGPGPNPHGLAFARLKRLPRSDGHRDIPALMTPLGSAPRSSRPDECRAYIRHSGYGRPPAKPLPNRR
ncbi:MAG: hypothetical protein K2X87_33990, partial [Gemmataceae bacterium]|nr:hypothetical protein [Gemmataceae bacterium]